MHLCLALAVLDVVAEAAGQHGGLPAVGAADAARGVALVLRAARLRSRRGRRGRREGGRRRLRGCQVDAQGRLFAPGFLLVWLLLCAVGHGC